MFAHDYQLIYVFNTSFITLHFLYSIGTYAEVNEFVLLKLTVYLVRDLAPTAQQC